VRRVAYYNVLTKIFVNNNRNVIIDCKRLKSVLKKCANIVEINFGEQYDKYENMDEVMQTITNYCHKLNKIHFEFKIILSFIQEFYQTIKQIFIY
jgi:hypothetical protein